MDAEGCKLSTYLSLEHFHYFQVFEFLQVKSDVRTLPEVLGFQLQLGSCKHEVMIAASVAPGKNLIIDLKRLDVRMKSIWFRTCPFGACHVAVLDNLWGWRVLARVSWCGALYYSESLHPLSFVSPMHNPCPVLVCVWAYFGIPTALNYKYILLGSLLL